jgi:hypothetical protein
MFADAPAKRGLKLAAAAPVEVVGPSDALGFM